MVYFTGDIHGFPWGVYNFCKDHKLTNDDIVVLLGDVGANYYNNQRDDAMKKALADAGIAEIVVEATKQYTAWKAAQQ